MYACLGRFDRWTWGALTLIPIVGLACNLSDPLAGDESDGSASVDSGVPTDGVSPSTDGDAPTGSDSHSGSGDATSPIDSASDTSLDSTPRDADTSTGPDADTTPGYDTETGPVSDADTTPGYDADSDPASDADAEPTSDADTSGGDDTDAEETDVCATQESCDGVDNDCDGVVDEGCSCIFDPTEADSIDTDGSHDAGVCTGQIIDTTGDCAQPTAFESPESSCSDGLDNDCDGAVDSNDPNCSSSGAPGAVCSSDADCDNGPCVSDGSGSVCAHTVFMTNADVTGDFGGLSGMDNRCDNAASNAGFSGNWQTVASSSAETARNRTSVVAPIYNTNGDRVADDEADLWDGSIQNSLNYDETGTTFVGPTIATWTGTTSGGASTGVDCQDWSTNASTTAGTFGDAKDTSRWADDSTSDCDSTYHIYCIDGQ